MNSFRQTAPVRTYKGTYKNYRSYKPHIAKDFNNRCGYTDCSDMWFGGRNNFHIDHFIPWKKHKDKPELKTDYANLVYACSYVNIIKSDDEGQYLDPCNEDFNNHFERDIAGRIVAKATSPQAIYMFKKLKLHLRRYQVIWMLDQLYAKMKAVQAKIESIKDENKKNDLKILQGELGGEMIKYLDYLSAVQ